MVNYAGTNYVPIEYLFFYGYEFNGAFIVRENVCIKAKNVKSHVFGF